MAQIVKLITSLPSLIATYLANNGYRSIANVMRNYTFGIKGQSKEHEGVCAPELFHSSQIPYKQR